MFKRINRGALAFAIAVIAAGISAAAVFAHPWRDHEEDTGRTPSLTCF